MADKPSTDDILKKIRQQSAVGGDAAASDDAAAESSPVAEEPAAEKPKAAPADSGDLLAKIRAQGAAGSGGSSGSGGESAPEKSAKKAAPAKPGDILSQIRAQGSGGAAQAAAGPAAGAPAKKKTAVAAPAGDLPPVDQMLEQMKAGKKPTAAAAPVKPQLKVPVKPQKKAGAAEGETRRNVLLGLVATPFALAWTLLTVTSGAWVLGIARFMFPNVLVEPPSQFKIGPASDYPLGTVSTKWTAARGIWVVHTDQYKGKNLIYALASVCTHLGCTPSWLEGEQKFKCPCHGSGFYINGINFEGPAPRPLERVGLRVAPDGMLEVDKSVKFQEEKGQWEDAKSFVDGTLV